MVAFILALVVRGFEAQAFVIPDRLDGSDPDGPSQGGELPAVRLCLRGERLAKRWRDRSVPGEVSSGICVNCRFQAPRLDDTPSFKGDRILVMMFPYDLPFLPGSSPPERWDVVVFRYPEETRRSAISSVWSAFPARTSAFPTATSTSSVPAATTFHAGTQAAQASVGHADECLRRPLPAQRTGDDSRMAALATDHGGRVEASIAGSAATRRVPRPSDQWVELRYQHLVPDPEQWDAIVNDEPLPREPRSTLITDFYSYNTNMVTEKAGCSVITYDENRTAWMPATLGRRLHALGQAGGCLGRGRDPIRADQRGSFHTVHRSTWRPASPASRAATRRCSSTRRRSRDRAATRSSSRNVDDRLTLLVNGRSVWRVGYGVRAGGRNPDPHRRRSVTSRQSPFETDR